MAEFLVEAYASRTDARTVEDAASRARAGARALTREGTPVRLLRTIFVPEEETSFFLYEAVSADAVREAARRAALRCDGVRAAVTDRRESHA